MLIYSKIFILVQQLLAQYGFDKMITQINYQGKVI